MYFGRMPNLMKGKGVISLCRRGGAGTNEGVPAKTYAPKDRIAREPQKADSYRENGPGVQCFE